jgi:hypothetical protein
MPNISSTADRGGVADGSINETYTDPTDIAARKESITKAAEHPIGDTTAATVVTEGIEWYLRRRGIYKQRIEMLLQQQPTLLNTLPMLFSA